MPKTFYWKYRAYDRHENVSEGLFEGGTNHLEVIFTLRQKHGLQVIDLLKISEQQYVAERRAKRLQHKIGILEAPHQTNESRPFQIRWSTLLFAFILLVILSSIVYALMQ